jgi:hypothetical protein
VLPLLVVATVAAEERRPVVEQDDDEHERERDPDGRPPEAVDGVRRAPEGEDIGERGGASVGGEDADDDDEADGEQQEPHGAEELRDGARDGLPAVAHEERPRHQEPQNHRHEQPVRRPARAVVLLLVVLVAAAAPHHLWEVGADWLRLRGGMD